MRLSPIIRAVPWQAIRTQLARFIGLLLIVTLICFAATVITIILQAQRDESRRVDSIVIVAPTIPPASLIERSFDLYRRGYATEITLVGPGYAALQSALLAQGVSEEVIQATEAAAPISALQSLQQAGTESILVVSAPSDQLLYLKMAHDYGLRAYGVAISRNTPDLLDLLQSANAYWSYVLFRQ